MTSLEPKDLILEIIARLRSRKARPDLEKISHMAKRKYGLNTNRTEEMLNKLVVDGIVNKVTYKGRTSYRNAAKCSKSRSNNFEILNRKASAKLRDAINALTLANNDNNNNGGSCSISSATGSNELNIKIEQKIKNDSNNNEEETISSVNNNSAQQPQTQDKSDSSIVGVSFSQIEKWWSEQSFDATLSKVDLNTVIKNELASRRLQTLPNGNYVRNRANVSTTNPVGKKTANNNGSATTTGEKRSQQSSSSTDGNKNDRGGCIKAELQFEKTTKNPPKNCAEPKPPCKRGRPASKRKKFLKDHGPDFQAEIPVAILGINKCDLCFQTADSKNNVSNESLLYCKDCSAKAHPSCMSYSPELALQAQQSPWQCNNCKLCNICQDSGTANGMLICNLCDKGYHINCLAIPLNNKPNGKWTCSVCDKVKEKSPISLKDTNDNNKGNCMYEPPTPCESPELQPSMNFPTVDHYGELQKRRSVYDGPYPDVTDYTVDEIVQFFKSKGFGKEANAFSEQEIDGKSLLLMKRDDVLMGLRDYICLGPALKIFKHVERLQWASE